jgi:sortase A
VGNVAIAGHRTTYGRPFNRLDQMRPGDDVWLMTPVGDYRYVVVDASEVGWVANPLITLPKDWSVIAPTSNASLTLTTCHPKGSAAERLIVRAQLEETFEAGYYDREVATAAA